MDVRVMFPSVYENGAVVGQGCDFSANAESAVLSACFDEEMAVVVSMAHERCIHVEQGYSTEPTLEKLDGRRQVETPWEMAPLSAYLRRSPAPQEIGPASMPLVNRYLVEDSARRCGWTSSIAAASNSEARLLHAFSKCSGGNFRRLPIVDYEFARLFGQLVDWPDICPTFAIPP